MRTFDVQAVELECGADHAFEYLADPGNLPEWTRAFKAVSGRRATLATPEGSTEIDLEVRTDRSLGTVDWVMTFPDGSVGRALSRVIDAGKNHAIYCFILTAPPVPLEHLEGALDQQSKILRHELEELKVILSRRDDVRSDRA